MGIDYLHLPAGLEPPPMEGPGPFRAVLVLNQAVTGEWRERLSAWLVRSGCLYMMAWGPDSSAWDDSVDYANLSAADFGDVPDDRFVMTTWHDAEPLSETFWFAGHAAHHPTVDLNRTLIIDISPDAREAGMLAAYAEAQVLA
jgi:hypothetical protein